MKNSLQKGFTLIELLVVIAIIGILSSVVLASLTTARSKGTDAAVQSTLSNMRAQAELYYSTNNSYGTSTAASTVGTYAHCHLPNTVFAASSTVGGLYSLLLDASSKTGGTLSAGKVACASSPANTQTAWAVLASTTSGSVCVDSTGASKTTSTGITNTQCN